MRIIAVKRSRKVYALVLLIACIVMTIGYVAIRPDSNVTVYDNRFKILDYGISRGTTHTFYDGNQTIGRIRARARSQFGLKFIGLSPSTTLRMAPESLIFFLRYRGDLPFEELDGLSAVLTNGDDIFEQMQDTTRYDQVRQTFIKYYILPKVLASDVSLRIDFYLKSDYEKPIATWRIGELNKHNKGFNTEL